MVRDLWPGAYGSFPTHLTDANDRLYFVASDGVFGREIWRTDGTEAGTVRMTGIAPDVTSTNPSELRISGNRLYFSAADETTGDGYELWALSLAPTSLPEADPAQVGGEIVGTYTTEYQGTGISAVYLWVREPGDEWTSSTLVSDNVWSHTPTLSGPAANGEYHFATVAIDNGGFMESPPEGEDHGDVVVVYNHMENAPFTVVIGEDGTVPIPLSANVEVQLSFSGIGSPITVTVTRTVGNNAPNMDLDAADFINEFLTITGDLNGATATLTWAFDPANSTLSPPHNGVFQFSGGNLINVYNVSQGSNPVIVGGITTFSEWWIGITDTNVEDWLRFAD